MCERLMEDLHIIFKKLAYLETSFAFSHFLKLLFFREEDFGIYDFFSLKTETHSCF